MKTPKVKEKIEKDIFTILYTYVDDSCNLNEAVDKIVMYIYKRDLEKQSKQWK